MALHLPKPPRSKSVVQKAVGLDGMKVKVAAAAAAGVAKAQESSSGLAGLTAKVPIKQMRSEIGNDGLRQAAIDAGAKPPSDRTLRRWAQQDRIPHTSIAELAQRRAAIARLGGGQRGGEEDRSQPVVGAQVHVGKDQRVAQRRKVQAQGRKGSGHHAPGRRSQAGWNPRRSPPSVSPAACMFAMVMKPDTTSAPARWTSVTPTSHSVPKSLKLSLRHWPTTIRRVSWQSSNAMPPLTIRRTRVSTLTVISSVSTSMLSTNSTSPGTEALSPRPLRYARRPSAVLCMSLRLDICAVQEAQMWSDEGFTRWGKSRLWVNVCRHIPIRPSEVPMPVRRWRSRRTVALVATATVASGGGATHCARDCTCGSDHCASTFNLFIPGTWETDENADPSQPVGMLKPVADALENTHGSAVEVYTLPYMARAFDNGHTYADSKADAVSKAKQVLADVANSCPPNEVHDDRLLAGRGRCRRHRLRHRQRQRTHRRQPCTRSRSVGRSWSRNERVSDCRSAHFRARHR